MAKIAQRVGGVRQESIHSISQTNARYRKVQKMVGGFFEAIPYRKEYLNKYVHLRPSLARRKRPHYGISRSIEGKSKARRSQSWTCSKAKGTKTKIGAGREKQRIAPWGELWRWIRLSLAIDKLEESKYSFTSTTHSTVTTDDSDISVHEYENPVTGNLVPDQGSQTIFSKYMLSAKVDTMILKNEVALTRPQPPKIVSSLSYEKIVQNSSLMKHFVGLTSSQFEVLHKFLDHVSLLNTINYWNCKDSPAMEKGNTGPDCQFSTSEQLFMCLKWDWGEVFLWGLWQLFSALQTGV